MKVTSMRITEDIDQAINCVSQLENIEKTQSLRKLARLGFEYYVAKILWRAFRSEISCRLLV